MPDNNTPPRVDLTAAPAGSLSFDDLFPLGGESLGVTQLQPTPQGTNPPVAEPQAAPVVPPSDFLKAGTTVYKTQEDAINGIQHKDTLIGRYREFLQSKGIDPNTLQSIEPQTPAPTPTPTSGPTYLGNGKRLREDLAKANEAGNADEWERILAQHQREIFEQQTAGIAPLIADVARQRAVRAVASEAQDFNTFYGSENFQSTLSQLPTLKEAIQIAESNPSMADKLQELYKMTWLIHQGLHPQTAPATPTVATPVVPQNSARPTISSSTMTPPPPSAPQNLTTVEGRKAYLEQAKASGIMDLKF